MSTHKYIDRICVAVAVLSLLLTVVFMNGEAFGLMSSGKVIGYENRLLDPSRVHTIDIVMDDWEGFIETCQSEEYSACNLVIDGESYKNVGIRGKGNTSLSSVAAMGSSRYSFKIEFDQYDGAKSYHGLDKLCLNNLIQDNTMMKDYLTYQLMNAFDAVSPLCSFAYITVNGEDWGLYLAVEGVEDAFLQRNYGSDYGNLYKPDSMSFGGGRGNGRNFDIGDFAGRSGESGGDTPGEPGQRPDSGGAQPPEIPGNGLPDGTSVRPTDAGHAGPPSMPGGGGGFGPGGSSDVKLQYIDDDPDSYANIFDSAKTDPSEADKERLIASLKSLSGFENLENVLDIPAVLRYFVVHSFVVNGDSYTGGMIHNYYLYEEDGRLSMIPWDYNLAFGTFSGGAATASVNDAIDDALDDRPMQAWIFSDETYTERYHELYAQFLGTADPLSIIDSAYAMIADYVKKDPTKFCTDEKFEAGVKALRSFCSLRRESVQGQLDKTVPSTDEQQSADPSALVDAGGLNLSDMGTMNGGGGPGGFGSPGRDGRDRARQDAKAAFSPSGPEDGADPGQPEEGDASGPGTPGAENLPSPPGKETSGGEGFTLGGQPGNGGFSPPDGNMPEGFVPPENQAQTSSQGASVLLLGLSALVLAAGIWIAFCYKR